jgi:mannose-1-phosphate guanylyltransferase/mannose-1-phosphate guanylyltransferase/mannose-6-phosphate isomerase
MPDTVDAYAVLLAGGSGTRLWPVSRTLFPKQLVHFIGKESLVQRTVKRLVPKLAPERIRIVCGRDHLHQIGRHIAEVGLSPDKSILTEPCGRNTAPAILLALLNLAEGDSDAVVCVFPADHVIDEVEAFHRKLTEAVSLARDGRIVTFGIRPEYPETGYGYIEGGQALDGGALAIRRFVEKPDLPTARSYLEAGNFFWNSGMFAFRADVMIEEFSRHCPDLLSRMRELTAGGREVDREGYGRLNGISFDHAIMEKTDRGAVLPSEFGWSDIGSWKSLFDFLPKDENGNVIDGNVFTLNTTGSFIMGYERLIAVNGLEKVVVVETPDSVFVSDLDHSRDVKQIVDQLTRERRRETRHHRTVHARWGRRTELDAKTDYLAERLVVDSDSRLEIAADRGRIRHLIVVRGRGVWAADSGSRPLSAGDNAVVPENEKGELRNDEQEPLVVLAVECPY